MGADPTDAELIRCCREPVSGDAFATLYRRHAGAVLAFLRGILRDEELARDALQESFFRFHGALDSFQLGRPLRPWLLRIARNASLDMIKRKSTSELAQPPDAIGAILGCSTEPGPLELASRREACGLLRAVVLRLPEEERAVFLLKHDHGLTYEEAAEALGCSVRTAKYRMKAALGRIGREAERLGVEA